MIYNFRFDRYHRDEVIRRLKEDKLMSQGWGGGEKQDLQVDIEDFVARCYEYYNLATTRIPSNLTWMREFKDGDMLVSPHLPEDGKVSIHLIDGDFPLCYEYISGDSTHMNHCIKVKESFGLQGNISIYNSHLISWYARLQWLRLPILPIKKFENDFKLVVNQLKENPEKEFGVSDLEEYFDQVRRDILSFLRDKLNSIDSSKGNISFERVCEHLLVAKGYKIDRRNYYDNKGGDVDLLCIRERSDSSPFETGETTLFIQVKKHSGITDEVAVNQLLSMMKQHPHVDGCVMSLANDFKEKAVEKAENNGILLMNGETICTLLASQLMQF